MTAPNENNTMLLGLDLNYSLEDAAESIDNVITMLTDAKRRGMEFVVMESGNYRGAKYVTIPLDWEPVSGQF